MRPTATEPLRRIADLPGPRGLPIVGNLFQARPPLIHRDVERWCRTYGPVFRMRFLKREMVVVVGDHALLAEMLRDRPEGWRRSPLVLQIALEMGLYPGVFSSEGEAWRPQRRMVMAGLDPGRVRAYFPTMHRVTERLARRWQAAAESGRPLELQSELMRYTVDTVAGLAFGRDINTLEDQGDVIQQHLDRILPTLFRRVMSPVPYWRWFKLPRDRAVDRSVAEVHRRIGDFIAEARARLAADPARRAQPPNLLESMIVAAEEGREGIDDRTVSANVFTMLLAGEDTTAHTLAWVLHLLHRNPATLARVMAEARREVPVDRPCNADDLAKLDVMDACLNEAMRLKPVAPFAVLHALRDTTIGDLQVPAGTEVWCALRHDSLQAHHFPEPDAFRPERWLAGAPGGEGAGDAPANLSSAKRVAMPFGAGPRICPGRYLALTEMKLLLAMLFTRFDIVSVDAPGGSEAAERMKFTMTPVGLTMRLAPRAR